MENARSGCKRDCDKSTTEQRDNDLDEKELERLAVESLTREAKRRKVRAEEAGPSAWTSRPVLRTNKRFLNTVVSGTVATNKRKERQQQHREQHSECRQDSESIDSRSTEKEKKSRNCTASTLSVRIERACKNDKIDEKH